MWEMSTGYGFDGKVPEAADGPGVLVGSDQRTPVRGIFELVDEELGVGLHRVDAAGSEE